MHFASQSLRYLFSFSAAWSKDYSGVTDMFDLFFFPQFQLRYAKYFFADGAWPVASCRACSLLCATLCVSDKAGPIHY